MRKTLSAIAPVGAGFCAAFLVYLVIGGLIGFAVQQPFFKAPACLPHITVFAVLETDCEIRVAKLLWAFLAEIPRTILVLPALSLAMLKAFARNRWAIDYLLESVPWAAYSTPALLMSWVGFHYVHRVAPIAAWLLALTLAGEILCLAWYE